MGRNSAEPPIPNALVVFEAADRLCLADRVAEKRSDGAEGDSTPSNGLTESLAGLDGAPRQRATRNVVEPPLSYVCAVGPSSSAKSTM